jgi:hypothetical protein
MTSRQVQLAIGLDGPDSYSPRAEIEAEIRRLEAVPQPHDPLLTSRIEELHRMLAQATEKGGFRPEP